MKLAPITKSDFPLWSQYRTEVYPDISPEHDLKEIESISTSDVWHCWFVETDSGERIGLVELSLRNIVDGCLSTPVPYLEGLYLIGRERGKGSGARVLELLIQWCRKSGYSELATDTELENTRAQRFYRNLGFEETDRVVEYRLELSRHRSDSP